MTQTPGPPPLGPPALPYEAPPPAARPRATLSTVIAWLIILASAAYIITTTAIEKRNDRAAALRTGDIGFRISARYAVGAHHIFSGLAAGGAGGSPSAPLLAQVDAAAKTPDEKVEAATIAGEMLGPDEALKRLESLPADVQSGEAVAALRALYTGGKAASLTPAQRQILIDRYGWFGHLALSYGLPGDDPARQAVLRPAIRTVWLLFGATGIGGVALLTGFVLLVIAIVFWSSGRLTRAYRPPITPTGPFLEAFAVYMAAMVGLGAVARFVLGRRLVATWFVLVALPFVFLWPLLRGIPRGQLGAGLGWHRGRGWFREIGAGIVGYLAGLPVLAVGGAVTLVLTKFSGSDTSHPIVNELAGSGWRILRLFFLAAVWAPIVEETMFRGALYHHLRGRLSWPAAATLVAILFAAIHPQGWAAVPVLGAIAFSFATIREWRGSVIAPVVAHALNNGAVTLLLILLLK